MAFAIIIFIDKVKVVHKTQGIFSMQSESPKPEDCPKQEFIIKNKKMRLYPSMTRLMW